MRNQPVTLPIQLGPIEIDSTEVNPLKVDILKISLTNIYPIKVSSTEVGSIEVSLTEVGILKIGSTEVCPTKVSSTKIGSTKVGSTKVGSMKVGSTKVGSTKIDSTKIDSMKANLIEVGPMKVDSTNVDFIVDGFKQYRFYRSFTTVYNRFRPSVHDLDRHDLPPKKFFVEVNPTSESSANCVSKPGRCCSFHDTSRVCRDHCIPFQTITLITQAHRPRHPISQSQIGSMNISK